MALLLLAARMLSRRPPCAAAAVASPAFSRGFSQTPAGPSALACAPAAAGSTATVASGAAAAAPAYCSGQHGARGFAAETAADKYELFSPEAGLTHIEGYTADGFIVNDITLRGGLLALRNGFYCWDAGAQDFSAISLLSPLPEVLVFGTGDAIRPPPPQLVRSLAASGVGLEVSNTVNAIATFNILAQEGRHVAGAFVPMEAPERG